MAHHAVTYDPDLHDQHRHYHPTAAQTLIALAMLNAAHDASAVMVPIAAPGKQLGAWRAGQTVDHPPGYFLAKNNDPTEPESFAVARREARAAAERHMNTATGVAGWAEIHRDGHWIVTESVNDTR
jgi:hypothetical protein